MYACITQALKDYVGPLRQQIAGTVENLVKKLGHRDT
jgi:hypothetical protein